MKSIKRYISVLSVALLFGGCVSDLEQVTYDPANATAAVIESLSDSYVLSVDSSDQVAVTFKWAEADFGYSASVTNNLQIDLSGGDFSQATTIASLGLAGEYSITHAELNSAVTKLVESYGEELAEQPYDVDIRLSSSISSSVDPLISDVVSTTITPYTGSRIYPSIAVRGDYSDNGWDFDASQKLYSVNDDGIYSGMVFFNGRAANGWKLCEDSGWSNNWGTAGGEASEATSWVMTHNGGNIELYSMNSYYFTFNYSTLEFTMSKPHSSWGIVGSPNEWGDTGVADHDMEMVMVGSTFYMKAVVEFEAGDEWKIRPDNSWGDDLGCSAVAVDATFTTDYGNFRIPDAGTYTIRWYFNSVEQTVEVLAGDVADEEVGGGTEEPDPEDPEDELGVGDDDAVDEGYSGPDNSDYNSIALRGDYNGWSFDAAQRLFSAENDSSYGAMIYLDGKGANGWKLCLDADWVTSWGLLTGEEEAEQSPITLLDNSQSNINIYTMNSYYATFDSETLELTMSAPHTSWGIVGAYNSWGGSADTDMALACRDNVYYLHATLEFETGSEWKIRPDSEWNDDLGCYAVTVDEAFCTAEDNGNFIIPEAGIYTIRWYFNSVNQEVRVIKHADVE